MHNYFQFNYCPLYDTVQTNTTPVGNTIYRENMLPKDQNCQNYYIGPQLTHEVVPNTTQIWNSNDFINPTMEITQPIPPVIIFNQDSRVHYNMVSNNNNTLQLVHMDQPVFSPNTTNTQISNPIYSNYVSNTIAGNQMFTNINYPSTTNNIGLNNPVFVQAFPDKVVNQSSTECVNTSNDSSDNNTNTGRHQNYVFEELINTEIAQGSYACPIKGCGRVLKRKDDLSRHMKIHSRERPFICPYCSKGFGRKDHLKGHIRTHTKEKPYQCIVCSRAFARSDERRRHMKVHDKENRQKEVTLALTSSTM